MLSRCDSRCASCWQSYPAEWTLADTAVWTLAEGHTALWLSDHKAPEQQQSTKTPACALTSVSVNTCWGTSWRSARSWPDARGRCDFVCLFRVNEWISASVPTVKCLTFTVMDVHSLKLSGCSHIHLLKHWKSNFKTWAYKHNLWHHKQNKVEAWSLQITWPGNGFYTWSRCNLNL